MDFPLDNLSNLEQSYVAKYDRNLSLVINIHFTDFTTLVMKTASLMVVSMA